MKKLVYFLFIFSIQFLEAQINFEKGYIITADDSRKEVLIQNHFNVQKTGIVQYKINETGKIAKAGVNDIKEFGIGEDVKYISRNVEVEVKETANGQVRTLKDPNFKNEQIFLKVVLQGKASLYEYSGGQIRYYFSTTDSENIRPLIYRKYTNGTNKILENEQYRKQLFDELNCSEDTSQQLRNIDYNSKKMIQYFEDYNRCVNSESVLYFEKDNRFQFNINVKAGVNYSKFQLTFGSISGPSREFSNKSAIGFRPAIETEAILPFYKNKFAAFVELAYLDFDYQENRYNQEVIVSFSSLEIPLGARYYMYLSDRSKLFINAALVPVFNFNSEVTLQNYEINLKNKAYIQAGIGAKFLEKFSAEVRYSFSRDIIEINDPQWYSDFSSIGFILGYTIL